MYQLRQDQMEIQNRVDVLEALIQAAVAVSQAAHRNVATQMVEVPEAVYLSLQRAANDWVAMEATEITDEEETKTA